VDQRFTIGSELSTATVIN